MTELLDVAGLLDEAILEDTNDFPPPTSWRMSDLGKCLRMQVLKRQGVVTPEPFTVKTRTLFRIGNLLEEEVLKWLSRKFQVITKSATGDQIKVSAPGYDARGSLDGIGIDNEGMFPIEVKSTRDRGVDYAPYETHDLQATAYALFLGLMRACLVYIGRDGARKVCWVYVTPKKEQRIKTEWAELAKWWLTDELPPVKPKVRAKKKVKGVWVDFTYEVNGVGFQKGEPKYELDPECSRCPYLNFCWGDAHAAAADRGTETQAAESAD